MKKPVVTALATGICLVLAGGLASADSDKDHCGKRGHWGQRIMDKLDKNKDGKVTRKEFDEAREARRKARFARMDVNKDGHVTLDEYMNSRGKWGNRFFDRFDHNKDGVIDREEAETPPFGRHGEKQGMHHEHGWHKPDQDPDRES
jgi:hypothetical protein